MKKKLSAKNRTGRFLRKASWSAFILLMATAGSAAQAAILSAGDAALVQIIVEAPIDTDNDGLLDDVEILLGTNPYHPDTDGDSLPDGWEVENGLDPLTGTDAAQDSDSDSLTNADEYALGTYAYLPDSDDDGFWDGIEMQAGTDPLSSTSVPQSTVRGDVNCDGLVDAFDVQLVINGALRLVTPAPTDMDASGSVDAMDVQIVINAALGL